MFIDNSAEIVAREWRQNDWLKILLLNDCFADTVAENIWTFYFCYYTVNYLYNPFLFLLLHR